MKPWDGSNKKPIKPKTVGNRILSGATDWDQERLKAEAKRQKEIEEAGSLFGKS